MHYCPLEFPCIFFSESKNNLLIQCQTWDFNPKQKLDWMKQQIMQQLLNLLNNDCFLLVNHNFIPDPFLYSIFSSVFPQILKWTNKIWADFMDTQFHWSLEFLIICSVIKLSLLRLTKIRIHIFLSLNIKKLPDVYVC